MGLQGMNRGMHTVELPFVALATSGYRFRGLALDEHDASF